MIDASGAAAEPKRPLHPLRIGIGAPYDLSLDGGVNTHIRAQARALRRAGHHVVVFGASSAPLENGEVSLGGCVSLVVGGTQTGFGADPRLRGRIIELFRAQPFDVLHLHEPLMPLTQWFALRHSPAPIVATFHVHREHGHSWYPRLRWLLAPLMRRVRVRLAVSEAARRTVVRDFPGHYAIVPNGIDCVRFEQPRERPPEMRGSGPFVLAVGRLEPRKGVGALIAAMRLVRERIPAARLVLVGDGPDRNALDTAARQAGVDVSFAGRVADAALPAYYRAADVVCSVPVGGESFGIVLLEAMAAGRPIVATRIEGYEELLAGADSGPLVAIGDPVELANAITDVLADPERGRTLGEHGAAFAVKYDWNTIAKRLEAIYAGTLTSGQNEYGSVGLKASDASERFERPLTR
jgi:phosphatidyl-myo-inositol alpha-mannosyltransferase